MEVLVVVVVVRYTGTYFCVGEWDNFDNFICWCQRYSERAKNAHGGRTEWGHRSAITWSSAGHH